MLLHRWADDIFPCQSDAILFTTACYMANSKLKEVNLYILKIQLFSSSCSPIKSWMWGNILSPKPNTIWSSRNIFQSRLCHQSGVNWQLYLLTRSSLITYIKSAQRFVKMKTSISIFRSTKWTKFTLLCSRYVQKWKVSHFRIALLMNTEYPNTYIPRNISQIEQLRLQNVERGSSCFCQLVRLGNYGPFTSIYWNCTAVFSIVACYFFLIMKQFNRLFEFIYYFVYNFCKEQLEGNLFWAVWLHMAPFYDQYWLGHCTCKTDIRIQHNLGNRDACRWQGVQKPYRNSFWLLLSSKFHLSFTAENNILYPIVGEICTFVNFWQWQSC